MPKAKVQRISRGSVVGITEPGAKLEIGTDPFDVFVGDWISYEMRGGKAYATGVEKPAPRAAGYKKK